MDINTTLQKKSLAEEVSSLIREQINDGKLTKGEKLPTEPELMKLFGVGRSTIRVVSGGMVWERDCLSYTLFGRICRLIYV